MLAAILSAKGGNAQSTDEEQEEEEISQESQGRTASRSSFTQGFKRSVPPRRQQEPIPKKANNSTNFDSYVAFNNAQTPRQQNIGQDTGRIPQLHREFNNDTSRGERKCHSFYLEKGFYTLTKAENSGKQSDGDGAPVH